MIGWVPPTCADADDVAIHLNLRIPKGFRYALHQLFWIHSTSRGFCCANATSGRSPFTGVAWCPIEQF